MPINFSVLSEQQIAWMQRVVKQMIELTGYYSLTKSPMEDADYDNVINLFSDYTKKSRNNAMIIRCANVLAEYLEKTEKQIAKYPKLDAYQMKQVETFTTEQFAIAGKWQGKIRDKDELQKAEQELDDCLGKYFRHEMPGELSAMFHDYLKFCLKERLGKQLLEQQSEAAGREPPNNDNAEPEKKHTKIR